MKNKVSQVLVVVAAIVWLGLAIFCTPQTPLSAGVKNTVTFAGDPTWPPQPPPIA